MQIIFHNFFLLTCVKTIQFNYFNTPTFTDLQGWTANIGNDSIGTFIGTYNSLNYLGLGEMRSHLTSDAVYKMLYELPPHYEVRVSADIYTLSQQTFQLYQYVMKVQVDERLCYKYQFLNNLHMHRIEKITTFSTSSPHTSDSAFIRISLTTGERMVSTMGIRNLKIEFLECPIGCQMCQVGDSLYQCNQWSKLDYDLSEVELWNFNNDGWRVDGLQSNEIFTCDQQQKLNFFGLFDQDTKIIKNFILPPHYKIKIQVMTVLIQTDFIRYPNLIFEIDNQFYSELRVPIVDNSNICHYTYLLPNLFSIQDFVIRDVTNNIQHSSQNLQLRIYIQQQIAEVEGRWGIRDFQIQYAKCHSSCTKTCNGPSASDCIDQEIVYTLFYSTFSTQSITSQDGWDILFSYSTLSVCNGVQILGGYQKLQGQYKLEYNLTNLIKHSTISISFKFYQIDQFANEKFNIYLNDIKIYEYVLAPITDLASNFNFCGQGDPDLMQTISIEDIPHTSNFAVFSFTTDQGATSLSYWGISGLIFKLDDINYQTSISKSRNNVAYWWSYDQKQVMKITCTNNALDFYGFFQNDSKLRKIISNIPLHKTLHISFKILIKYTVIDDNENQIWLVADHTQIWSSSFSYIFRVSTCDNTSFSKIFKFETFLAHSNSVVLFEFLSTFQDDKYWAIREFELMYTL